jgi:hypothetical protein
MIRLSLPLQKRVHYPCGREEGAASLLDKDDRLRVWNVEALATISARKLVVNPHHVVARFGKAGAILFVRPTRQVLLLRPRQPAHFIVCALAAVWATEARTLRFLSFVKEISLVHNGVKQNPESRSQEPEEKKIC